MDNLKLIVMCGLPGAGKSYWSEIFSKKYHATIRSSDALRTELLGNISDQTNNKLVFDTLHKRLKKDLASGISCIYDACNLTRKTRKYILNYFKNIQCEKICIFVNTPLSVCLKNNNERDRQVPVWAITNAAHKIQTPTSSEGWSNIQIIDNERIQLNEYMGN